MDNQKEIRTERISGLAEWQATFEDWDLGDPVGLGKTEAEAIEDLWEQVNETK